MAFIVKHGQEDKDLATIRPKIEGLVKERRVDMVEDYLFQGYYSGLVGQMYVLRKICD